MQLWNSDDPPRFKTSRLRRSGLIAADFPEHFGKRYLPPQDRSRFI
jgi:hypothetical protein